jgi:hypothetical protein
MKEGIAAHVGELKGHADLGPKPKSVQPIRGEVYNVSGQTGENPVRKHVNELKWQASLKGEPAPLQPVPQEQQVAERQEMPPPPDGENPHRFRLRRSEKDPNNWVLEDPAYEQGGFQAQIEVTPDHLEFSPEDIHTVFQTMLNDYRLGLREIYKYLAKERKQSSSEEDQS